MMLALAVQNPAPIAGRFAFVDYGVVGEPWHERYICEVLPAHQAIVITPDYDVYVEIFDV